MRRTALFMYGHVVLYTDDLLIVNVSAFCRTTIPSILHCFLWIESRRLGKNQFPHQVLGYSTIYRASECLVVLFRSMVTNGFCYRKEKCDLSFTVEVFSGMKPPP